MRHLLLAVLLAAGCAAAPTTKPVEPSRVPPAPRYSTSGWSTARWCNHAQITSYSCLVMMGYGQPDRRIYWDECNSCHEVFGWVSIPNHYQPPAALPFEEPR